MYDDDNLSRSENYFTVLQLLRVFEETINQSIGDLEKLACLWLDDEFMFNDPGQIEASKVIVANWDYVISVYRGHAQGFLKRISGRVEEVRSLRDGVRSLPLPI